MSRTKHSRFDREDSEIEIGCPECGCVMTVSNETATCEECGYSCDLCDEDDFDFDDSKSDYVKNAEFGGMEW